MNVYYIAGFPVIDKLHHADPMNENNNAFISKYLKNNRNRNMIIKKGSVAQRISSVPYEYNVGPAFVSFDPIDHMRYAIDSTSDDSQVGGKGSGQVYSLDMEVVQDLVCPSYEQSMNAFVETVKNVGLDEVSKSVEKQYGGKYTAEQFVEDFKEFEIKESRDSAYVGFISTLIGDEKNRIEFFNALKKRGYNAIVDEYDVNFDNGSALIVFERDKNLKLKSVKKLSANDLARMAKKIAAE